MDLNPEALFVLIPGFGRPNIDHKFSLLVNNLTVLSRLCDTQLFHKIYLTICLYDTDSTVEASAERIETLFALFRDQFPNRFEFALHCAPGIVGQFMLRHAAPSALKGLDASISYCMLLLDDVELNAIEWTPHTWQRVFQDYKRHRLSILSPTLTPNSKYLFPYMLQRKFPGGTDVLTITSACEMFCYLMSFDIWERYVAELRDDHPLLWGIDLVLTKHLGFRVGMIHYGSVRHHYQSVQDPTNPATTEAFRQMEHYLSKFNETQQSLAHQPAVLEEIHIYHRTKIV